MRPRSISLKGDPPRAPDSAIFGRAPRRGDRPVPRGTVGVFDGQRERSRDAARRCTRRSNDETDRTARRPRTPLGIAHSPAVESPPAKRPRTRQRALVSRSSSPRRGGSTRWAAWLPPGRPSLSLRRKRRGNSSPQPVSGPLQAASASSYSLRRGDHDLDQVDPADAGEIGSLRRR